MGPPWGIDPTNDHMGSTQSHHEQTFYHKNPSVQVQIDILGNRNCSSGEDNIYIWLCSHVHTFLIKYMGVGCCYGR